MSASVACHLKASMAAGGTWSGTTVPEWYGGEGEAPCCSDACVRLWPLPWR